MEKFRFHNSQWLEMVENAAQNEMKRNFNRVPDYNGFSFANSQPSMGYDPYAVDYPLDDEPLENFVQDADALAMNRPIYDKDDFYVEETKPYDGTMSPDGLGLNENSNEMDFEDVDAANDDRFGIQSRIGMDNGGRKGAMAGYNNRYESQRSGSNYGGLYDEDEDEERYVRRNDPPRPKTGNKATRGGGIGGYDRSNYFDDLN